MPDYSWEEIRWKNNEFGFRFVKDKQALGAIWVKNPNRISFERAISVDEWSMEEISLIAEKMTKINNDIVQALGTRHD